MAKDRHGWRDGDPDELPCARCLELRDQMHLDRMLWCGRCRAQARNRAGWYGWGGGLVFGACVAAYVFLGIRPTDLVIGGWIATVVAAVWIGSKVCREVAYGIMRYRNVPGAESVPSEEG